MTMMIGKFSIFTIILSVIVFQQRVLGNYKLEQFSGEWYLRYQMMRPSHMSPHRIPQCVKINITEHYSHSLHHRLIVDKTGCDIDSQNIYPNGRVVLDGHSNDPNKTRPCRIILTSNNVLIVNNLDEDPFYKVYTKNPNDPVILLGQDQEFDRKYFYSLTANNEKCSTEIRGQWFLLAQVLRSQLQSEDIVRCKTINVTTDNSELDRPRITINRETFVINQTRYHINRALYIHGQSESHPTTRSIEIIDTDDDLLILHDYSERVVHSIYVRDSNFVTKKIIINNFWPDPSHQSYSRKILAEYDESAPEKRQRIEYADNRVCGMNSGIQTAKDLEMENQLLGWWYMIFEIYIERQYFGGERTRIHVRGKNKNLVMFANNKYNNDSEYNFTAGDSIQIYNSSLYVVNNNYLNPPVIPFKFLNNNKEILIGDYDSTGCYSLWSRDFTILYKLFEKYISREDINRIELKKIRNYNTRRDLSKL